MTTAVPLSNVHTNKLIRTSFGPHRGLPSANDTTTSGPNPPESPPQPPRPRLHVNRLLPVPTPTTSPYAGTRLPALCTDSIHPRTPPTTTAITARLHVPTPSICASPSVRADSLGPCRIPSSAPTPLICDGSIHPHLAPTNRLSQGTPWW